MFSILTAKLPEPLRRSLRLLRSELSIFSNSLQSRRIIRKIAEAHQIRLHLGCGGDVRQGWVNIDLATGHRASFQPTDGTGVLNFDLRTGLPFADSSISAIYSSHFWEHLNNNEGLGLFRESFRVLEPGGVFRLALPDVIRVLKAAFANDTDYLSGIMDTERRMLPIPGHDNIMDFINYCIFQYYEHKMIYDETKVIQVLSHVGFVNARTTQFDPSWDVDNELRRRYSFYIQAEKPKSNLIGKTKS